jgi:hypothetical protein
MRWRWLRWQLCRLLGIYAPEVCIKCGIPTNLCATDSGMPLCANCDQEQAVYAYLDRLKELCGPAVPCPKCGEVRSWMCKCYDWEVK